mmetsp:Transcript_30655/g.81544  ORF Transcript_30655/g.81544 Transcript_30655/m.81544 type:complete len:200 (-) Transcript_30655:187-786(-)
MLPANAVLDRVIHGVKEPMLTDFLPQLGLVHGCLDSLAHHREGHFDASLSELHNDVVDDVSSRRIDAHHCCHLQNHVLNGVHVLQIVDVGDERVLDERRVGEVQGGPNAHDEDVRDKGSVGLLLHVSVDGGARDAPQNHNLRTHGLGNHNDKRQTHSNGDSKQHSQEERPKERSQPQQKVRFLYVEEPPGFLVGHEGNH